MITFLTANTAYTSPASGRCRLEALGMSGLSSREPRSRACGRGRGKHDGSFILTQPWRCGSERRGVLAGGSDQSRWLRRVGPPPPQNMQQISGFPPGEARRGKPACTQPRVYGGTLTSTGRSGRRPQAGGFNGGRGPVKLRRGEAGEVNGLSGRSRPLIYSFRIQVHS